MKRKLDSAKLHYNLGLLYTEIEDYEKSLCHAKNTYEIGYRVARLRDTLIKVNVLE